MVDLTSAQYVRGNDRVVVSTFTTKLKNWNSQNDVILFQLSVHILQVKFEWASLCYFVFLFFVSKHKQAYCVPQTLPVSRTTTTICMAIESERYRRIYRPSIVDAYTNTHTYTGHQYCRLFRMLVCSLCQCTHREHRTVRFHMYFEDECQCIWTNRIDIVTPSIALHTHTLVRMHAQHTH